MIDIGYSSVKVSVLDGDRCVFNRYMLHHGKVKRILAGCLKEVESCYMPAGAQETCLYGALTGNGSRLLDARGYGFLVNETTALIEGALLIEKDAGSIIEIGGETAKYISGCKRGN
ncbi:hypothetical protein [Sediminispirochaeta bajacaliforniensis]|uniref:hypothetical protein n=1 Tax=Sediminispirochaeta bajacaliforniensis TaxID=148 RepID=UPI00039F5DF5|nr:hypothetical protein [Sediminispirochaeta bajacaliforniensis]